MSINENKVGEEIFNSSFEYLKEQGGCNQTVD